MARTAAILAGLAAAMLGGHAVTSYARAQESQRQDVRATGAAVASPPQAADTPANPATSVPACASDPDKLGIERIVEIDTAGGPVFGASYAHNSFLKDREVVLTFDDGPLRAYTRQVLKALDAHCTRATFFMVGRMAAADPAMVKEVQAAGHTVGTHTYAHKNLKPIGLLKGRSDFEMGLSSVSKAAGGPVAPFFRFPYLSESRSVMDYLKTRDTGVFFIDIDSKDFQTRNPNIPYERILSGLSAQRKGIILMHDIQPSTAGMIRKLLDTLHERGYKVVHVVPKVRATTVAEFDVSAEKALAAKGSKLKDAPLSSRSMVWTMTSPAPTASTPAAGPASATPSGQGAGSQGEPEKKIQVTIETPPAAAKSADELPWSKPQTSKSRTAASAAPARKPAKKRDDEELPWQARIFSN